MRLSQQDIAQILSVSYQQVQKYERGTNRLPIEHLCALQKFYNVSFDRFFTSTHIDLPTASHNNDLNIYLTLRNLKKSDLKQKIHQIVSILLDQ